VDAIELERELLADLREQAHVIDSSIIRACAAARLRQGTDLGAQLGN